MPRTPPLGAILGLSSAAWLMSGFARADEATPPVPTSQRSDASTPDSPPEDTHPAGTADGAAPSAKPSEPAKAPTSSAPVRFDEKTHFSLSWVRMPGAEDCVTGKKLSRAVEERLHRPVLGAPAESDVAIEGFIEKTEEGTFHAVVTITDAHGKLIGKRELEEASCQDMDDPLALAIALMIDPDAAFSATAATAPPRPRERASGSSVPPPKPAKLPPSFGGFVSAGITFGFSNMLPGTTAEGLWIIGAVTPPNLFPFELGAHLFRDQTIALAPGISAAVSRATVDLFACPLDLRVNVIGVGACAGLQVGTLKTYGGGLDGLVHQQQAVVDAAARGHLDLFFLHRFALRLMPALGVPLIRDYFEYQKNGSTFPAFRLSPVYGEASVGFGVKLP
jgi:hypothetical protein